MSPARIPKLPVGVPEIADLCERLKMGEEATVGTNATPGTATAEALLFIGCELRLIRKHLESTAQPNRAIAVGSTRI